MQLARSTTDSQPARDRVNLRQAAPTSMGYHSCDCIEEGFNIQQTGIEGDRMSASDVSSVPIVTNQSHPSSKIRACPDPE